MSLHSLTGYLRFIFCSTFLLFAELNKVDWLQLNTQMKTFQTFEIRKLWKRNNNNNNNNDNNNNNNLRRLNKILKPFS